MLAFNIMEQLNTNYCSYEYGRLLSNPPPGEEVVISGLSGKYPRSNNVSELAESLFNKEDLIDDDNSRWEDNQYNHPEIPLRSGKIPKLNKFDAGFFGMSYNQTTASDPLKRMGLEVAVEAIIDAGINPNDLEGTKTGVFIGNNYLEAGIYWFYQSNVANHDAIAGNEQSMPGHSICYHLKLIGPSFIAETACSSSLVAMEHAYQAIRSGRIENALVLGMNTCLMPYVTLQFARLGVLSSKGEIRPFDADGVGYVRAEAISALLLQKSKHANRVYATIVHAKQNCDGYKDTGISFPSSEQQTQLLKEVYTECQINPADVSFVEAHGTGTKAGDPEESKTLDNVFTKGRDTPLLIGSIKGNIGHGEGASGLSSVVKSLIAFESGYIPPNINYNKPKPEALALVEGRLEVVTTKRKFEDNNGLIAINNFGFGGANVHLLLKYNAKEKYDEGKLRNDIPRLVCVSGRTEEAINVLLDSIVKSKDVEHMRLLQNVFRKNIKGHNYRGFIVLNRHEEITRSTKFMEKEKQPTYVVFGEFKDTGYLFEQMLELPVFSDTIDKIQKVLSEKNLDVKKVITENGSNSTSRRCLANVFRQIGIIELLKAIKFQPSGFFGNHSVPVLGDLICAYYDGTLTLNETVEFAYGILLAPTDKLSTTNYNETIENNGKTTEEILQVLCDKLKDATKKQLLTSGNLLKSLQSNEPVRIVDLLPPKALVLQVGNLINNVSSALLGKKFSPTTLTLSSSLSDFLASVGRLYEDGHDLRVYQLFPHLEFPVSRGTPMISPAIRWHHERNWFVAKHHVFECDMKEFGVAIDKQEWSYIGDHVIDGRILFPATGYLVLAWKTLATQRSLNLDNMKVVFENCRFKRACTFTKGTTSLSFFVMIQRGTGNFEVREGDVTLVTGRIQIPNGSEKEVGFDFKSEEDLTENDIIMSSKDIYKELELRGYNYRGEFRGLQEYDTKTCLGKIQWNGNWIPFMDIMLQTKVLHQDSRLLYIPTCIDRIHIDGLKHTQITEQSEDNILPIIVNKKAGTIRSGGITISGLKATAIPTRKNNAIPVLEENIFVPNVAKLTLEQSLRVSMQLILENSYGITVKAVELIDDAADAASQPLSLLLRNILFDIPLIKPNITVFSNREITIDDMNVENRSLHTETDCAFIVGTNLLQRSSVLITAWNCLKPNGFILSRESSDVNLTNIDKSITVLTEHLVGNEKLMLIRKAKADEPHTVINISSADDSFSWLPYLQAAILKESKTILCAQNDPINGIIGLFNCVRAETGGANIKAFFILDADTPTFDPSHPFYSEQLKKNMSMNIFKDGVWGTFKHLLLDTNSARELEHVYVNTLNRGDLSTTKWVEGHLTRDTDISPDVLVHVYYAALNFRDIMLATAKITVDQVTDDRRNQECIQGFEFSGRTNSGRRVMGCASSSASATLVEANPCFVWDFPDEWTLEEAATVPVVYGTVLYGFFVRGNLQPGESVLIHSGTGGVGQAAIHLALNHGCTVYTTVGTKEKREYLLSKFPQLTDRNIANSRDITFETHVMKETKGRGVDVVLNSLADEKLIASVRCLARGGRFLEIGKYDLGMNSSLNLLLMEKEASFHGVMLDNFVKPTSKNTSLLGNLIKEALAKQLIKPIPVTVFEKDEFEEAYRYMSLGKHMGKIVVKLREEESDKLAIPTSMLKSGITMYYCDPEKVYIICGGLGGFGLELADWLVLRKCQKLLLTSRKGVTNGYQFQRIKIWKSYGCDVRISTQDIATKSGIEALIDEAEELAQVAAVFNLAVVLQDALLENQSEESFKIAFKPKAWATQYLDEITRQRCPNLKDFVVFSSVSCGRGNMGQSNYGMANSVMERICERRRKDGLPALAIQWGAIGDVGLVAEMQEKHNELETSGTLQQRISSCLKVMNGFLTQQKATIVSSMVVAEKKFATGKGNDAISAIANILGIEDIKAISFNATLAEVGMDSMAAVEIKQALERDFDIILTAQELKKLTLFRLTELQAEKLHETQPKEKVNSSLIRLELAIKLLGDAAIDNIPALRMQSKGTEKSPKIFLFPGIDGTVAVLNDFVSNLEANVIGLQYGYEKPMHTIEEMAESVLPTIEENISKAEPFKLIAYSFGSIVALDVVKKLEEKGYLGSIITIDGAPKYFKKMLELMFSVNDENEFQTRLLTYIMTMDVPSEEVLKHTEAILNCNSLEERLDIAHAIVGDETLSRPFEKIKLFVRSVYLRTKAVAHYNPEFKIKSKVTLFKPTVPSVPIDSEDYDLSTICTKPVQVKVFEGHHSSILENPELVKEVNATLQ